MGIQDIKIYFHLRLQKLKIKYEMNFKEKLTFYDKIEVSSSIIDNLNLQLNHLHTSNKTGDNRLP